MMKYLVLGTLLALVSCAGMPERPAKSQECKLVTEEASYSIAALKLCQETVGCNLTMADIREVQRKVKAAQECE